jgi:type VI secretion system protein ImpK
VPHDNPLDAGSPLAPPPARVDAGAVPPPSLEPEILSGTNPLVAAANPLLNLIPQLRATVQHPDPAQVREYLVQQIQAFELRARSLGVPAETVIGARYCLCTALDETAAQTPWGGSGIWSRHSLLVTFHNETWGGEKFFQLLAKLAQNPQQHGWLLELMYYCLALGFEGRFRIVDNGRTQLETLKQRLVQIIRQSHGEYERPLALHWQPTVPAPKRGWEHLPLWVTAVLAALLALGAFLWFLFALNRQSDLFAEAVNGIRAPRIVITKPPQPAPPRFAAFLAPEIRAGLVEVHDQPDRSVVILKGDGLFDPGQTIVKEQYVGILKRIADALNEVNGAVVVTGYTDNVPIRTIRFPSNFQLSQSRADVVKGMLDGNLKVANRVRAEGQADANPVAPNDTPANRARNRRVEVTLLVPPPDRDQQLRAAPNAPVNPPPAGATPIPAPRPPGK